MRSTMAFLLLLLLAGCRGNMTRSGETAGDTLAMKYAQNITIVSFPGYTKVSLTDPWKHGQVLHEYLLADSLRLDSLRHSSANDGRATLVRVPLCRSVVFNTAHASLIGMLHATKDIVGVADLEYMQLPEIHRLVGEGNTAVVIEHNLDVIKTADYIIDMGPDGGDRGGTVVAQGTPEEVAGCEESYTGQYIKKMLARSRTKN